MWRTLFKKIRHSKWLAGQELLWTFLRKPYQWLIDPLSVGVEVQVGGVSKARIPANMTGKLEWEKYEPENMQRYCTWLKSAKSPLVLDIGSSIGVFSLVALAEKSDATVFAFDSDLISLQALLHLVQYHAGNRVAVVQGLISIHQGKTERLQTRVDNTQGELAKIEKKPGEQGTQFICLNDPAQKAIPVFSLDELLCNEKNDHRSMLLKIDVEGAELLVLQGARQTIQKYHPDILISIHPPALPAFGHSIEEVEKELRSLGYQIELISVDHEIHWFCSPEKQKP